MRPYFPVLVIASSISLLSAGAARVIALPATTADSTPRVFAPGVISGPADEASPAFTPDGRTVFFTRSNPNQAAILVSQLRNGSWSTPAIASFSGEWRDIEPTMAPDGSYLIYASNRPATGNGKALDGFWNGSAQPGKGGNLWRVNRTRTGWGEPQRLPDIVNGHVATYSPSIAADGSLYFMQPTGASTKFHLFRARYRNGSYETPVQLSFSTDDAYGDYDPAVAADESFIVFSSGRPPAKTTSLFVAFRNQDGSWSSPEYMGDSVNAVAPIIEARLSPDNRTLYFSSTWVAPVAQPQTRVQTSSALAAMASWNNGLHNIWSVPMNAHRSASATSATSIGAEVHLSAAPQLIGAGVISTAAEEFKATVAPDGQTMLYTVTDHQFRHMSVVQSRRSGSEWVAPEVAPFSGLWRDGDPSFAPDGRSALFISNRPLPGDSAGTIRRDFNIWHVERQPDGSWSEPVALAREINTDAAEFAPSLTKGGDLYFSRGDSIYVARRSANGFQTPSALPFEGGDPAVASDGSFLVFDREHTAGDVDLYVSCFVAGKWTTPSHFADSVSSSAEEGDPSISADGKTLYFFSTRFATASVRAPRSARATYRQLEQEAAEVVLNGSRNLYQVDISSMHCPRD
jgi:Tol biopolymer transport system component